MCDVATFHFYRISSMLPLFLFPSSRSLFFRRRRRGARKSDQFKLVNIKTGLLFIVVHIIATFEGEFLIIVRKKRRETLNDNLIVVDAPTSPCWRISVISWLVAPHELFLRNNFVVYSILCGVRRSEKPKQISNWSIELAPDVNFTLFSSPRPEANERKMRF